MLCLARLTNKVSDLSTYEVSVIGAGKARDSSKGTSSSGVSRNKPQKTSVPFAGKAPPCARGINRRPRVSKHLQGSHDETVQNSGLFAPRLSVTAGLSNMHVYMLPGLSLLRTWRDTW